MAKPSRAFSIDFGTYVLRMVGRFLRHLWIDFWAYGCQKSAAALTYMTLFGIVPLMTVCYFFFSLIPAFNGVAEQLQGMIFSHFIPESGQELQGYLEDFSSQARSLTGFGVGMLVVTAYLMLTNIERTFNAIWGVQKSRRGLSSFLLYWAVLSLGPLLLGVAFALKTYMLSFNLLVTEYDPIGFSTFVFQLIPIATMIGAFTLLFVAVPNCRVPVRYALLGGIVTALGFELIKDLFTLAVANSSFQLVYGAFAVVPLFLLWVNLTWTLILAGAIFVRTLAEQRYFIEEGKATDMVATLKCLSLFRQRQKLGESVSDGACYRLGLGVVHWQHLRNRLEKHQWIVATTGSRYVLARDLDCVSLWDLAKVLDLQVHDLDVVIADPPSAPWFTNYLARRKAFVSEAKEIFGVSLEEFLGENHSADPVTAE